MTVDQVDLQINDVMNEGGISCQCFSKSIPTDSKYTKS